MGRAVVERTRTGGAGGLEGRRAAERRYAVVAGAAACLVVACGAGAAPFETVTTLPEPARHPAGAAVDPDTLLPDAEPQASTLGGLAVLETPADPAQARAVIAA